jgi:hypothetical protein
LSNIASLFKGRRIYEKWKGEMAIAPKEKKRMAKKEKIIRKTHASNYLCYVEIVFYYLVASIPQQTMVTL